MTADDFTARLVEHIASFLFGCERHDAGTRSGGSTSYTWIEPTSGRNRAFGAHADGRPAFVLIVLGDLHIEFRGPAAEALLRAVHGEDVSFPHTSLRDNALSSDEDEELAGVRE